MTRTTPAPDGIETSGERVRPSWRRVALPAEHGGWGLTVEPALLGLLVAPSWAGVAIAAAGVVAFAVRTPAKVVLVDHWRGRTLERTRLATRIVAVEAVILVALGVAATVDAGATWIVPVAIALPLFAVELWYDMRSRSRRLVPELCGAVAMGALATAIVVADDGSTRLAAALWIVVAARAVTSIPFVRAQIARLHGREQGSRWSGDVAGHVAAAVLGFAAVLVRADVIVGAITLCAIVAVHVVWATGPPRPAKVVGIVQMLLGIALVVATAIGVAAS